MTFENVMNEVHKWYDSISTKYADIIKFEISQNEKTIFNVFLENDRYIAQLVVEDIGFHPHRYVYLDILDADTEEHTYYFDSEKDSMSDIIEQLDRGIKFMTDVELW